MIRPLVFLLLLLPTLAFAAGRTPDEQTVMAADSAFHAASLTGGGQAWRDFADADALAGGQRGKDAIGAFYKKFYQPGVHLDWHPTYAKVIGDVGITSGPYRYHKDGDDKPAQTGRYVTVWRRQSDGGGRFAWDDGTPDARKGLSKSP